MKGFGVVVVAGLAAGAVAQTSPLYLGTGVDIRGVQGGAPLVDFPTITSSQFALAVLGSTIKTTGRDGAGQGDNYDLFGNHLGLNSAPSLRGTLDAASDGTNIYSVDLRTGDVLKYDSNFGSETVIFNPGVSGGIGITYDSTNNSLWIGEWTGTNVFNFDLTGSLLSSFSTGHMQNTALALDPADGTLWMPAGGDRFSGIFEQRTKTGTLLQSLQLGVNGRNHHGAEFGPVAIPMPTATVLAVAGLGLIGLRRRR